MTNEEKFRRALKIVTESSDDPRIVINVNVGMQLSEWLSNNPDRTETPRNFATPSERFNSNVIRKSTQ